MKTLLILALLIWICGTVDACDSVKDCSQAVEFSGGGAIAQAYGSLAVAYAIEDLAKAMRENK